MRAPPGPRAVRPFPQCPLISARTHLRPFRPNAAVLFAVLMTPEQEACDRAPPGLWPHGTLHDMTHAGVGGGGGGHQGWMSM